MAKRKSTSKRSGKSASRAPKTTEVEVVEEAGGAGWETGVAVMTGVILVFACCLAFQLT